MSEDSFILVNLKESKAKKLAQIISNDTSRKILDLLTQKDMSSSEIANALDVGLSTVHYNLKHLMDAKLIQVDEFHYSEKGKEVDHYKLSNKFVIIAPETSKIDSIRQKLSRILPVAAICGAGALVLRWFDTSFGKATAQFAPMAKQAVVETATKAVPMAHDMALSASQNTVVNGTGEAIIPQINQTIYSEPNIAVWFLVGALFALVVYFIADVFRKSK